MTINRAKALRRDDLGRLDVGGIGDATVLRVEEGDVTRYDVDGRECRAERRVVAAGVVRGGEYVPIRSQIGGQPANGDDGAAGRAARTASCRSASHSASSA